LIHRLTGGLGADSVLECRAGRVDAHGRGHRTRRRCRRSRRVPQERTIPNAQPTFYANITIAGGPAPVRASMHELMPDVLEGRLVDPLQLVNKID
jgi:hypothetical protein